MKWNKKTFEIIEWIDSCGGSGWHTPYEECELSRCVSIGWVTAESKSAITITSHVDQTTNGHHGDITIPKLAITNRKKVKL